MKFFQLLSVLFIVAILGSSCEGNRMKIRDTERGTPTNADTILPADKHHVWTPEEIQAYQKTLPRVYNR